MHLNDIITDPKQTYFNVAIVYGLGNWGKEYSYTPHNLGMDFIRFLTNNLELKPVVEYKSFILYNIDSYLEKVVANSIKLLFLLPKTYMNINHSSILALAKQLNHVSLKYNEKQNNQSLLWIIVHDELDLLWGRYKLTSKANTKHNGVRSAISGLKQSFPNTYATFLKIGAHIPSIRARFTTGADYLLTPLPPIFRRELEHNIFPIVQNHLLEHIRTGVIPSIRLG